MNKKGSNLLFLAAGAALGAAVTFVATSDKKEEWMREIGNMVDKIKTNIKEGKEEQRDSSDKTPSNAK